MPLLNLANFRDEGSGRQLHDEAGLFGGTEVVKQEGTLALLHLEYAGRARKDRGRFTPAAICGNQIRGFRLPDRRAF